jgi:hypothetical protein
LNQKVVVAALYEATEPKGIFFDYELNHCGIENELEMKP